MKNIQKYEIEELIPQRRPFVMVDSLVECVEKVSMSVFEIKRDNLFCNKEGEFSEAGLVENIAQTCAARIGYMALEKGDKVRIGVIGAVNKMSIERKPVVGELLETKIEVEEEVFNLTLVNAEISCDNKVIATCKMKIALTDKS